MINEEYKAMLGGKSVIRELSEYATSRGAEIGYQNVFDYSLGNPSVPAPKSFTDAMVDLYENGDPVAIHGYSPRSVSHPSRTRSPKPQRTFRHGIHRQPHLPDHGRGGRAVPRDACGDQAGR